MYPFIIQSNFGFNFVFKQTISVSRNSSVYHIIFTNKINIADCYWAIPRGSIILKTFFWLLSSNNNLKMLYGGVFKAGGSEQSYIYINFQSNQSIELLKKLKKPPHNVFHRVFW